MSKIDQTFQGLCKEIMTNGREYENKNRGVKRLQIPSFTLRHSFEDGFPAITNKKLYWNGIRTELLWFLRGDTNIKYLRDHKVRIWDKDAYNWYKKRLLEQVDNVPLSFEDFCKHGTGSVGQNYSAQWRSFNGYVDQIDDLIKGMKKDIMSSRLKVNAWNPAEIFKTALPPCHSEFQVIGVPLNWEQRFEILLKNPKRIIKEKTVINKVAYQFIETDNRQITFLEKKILLKECDDHNIPEFGFELHWNQRSVDTFLGLPFNIASYGALAKWLEFVTGYKALGIEGTLKCVHFYDNQYLAVQLLLERDPNTHPNCDMIINTRLEALDYDTDEMIKFFDPEDFKLINYTSDKAIKVDMLAPKEI